MEQSNIHSVKKAKRLIENGYQVVPIANGINGGGIPLIKGYNQPDTEYTEYDVLDWVNKFPDAGLALCSGKNDVYALDFDIDHPTVGVKFRNYVKKHWPDCVFRVCNPPRFAVLFRASDELKQIKNGNSVQLKTPDGKLNQIELLGNKPITLMGNHRKTGNLYRWPKGYSPLTTKAKDLPLLTLDDVTKLFDLFARHQPTGWKKVGESSLRKPTPNTTFENIKLTRRFSDDEVLGLLDEIDGSIRDNWRDVGMALHAQYDGNLKGFDIWDDWSSKFDGYVDTNDNRYAWDRFNTDGGLTMLSINRKVQRLKKPGEHNLENEDLLRFALDNYVLVEKPNEVGNLSRAVSQSMLNMPSMKSMLHNRYVEIQAPSGKSGDTLPKRVKLYDVWMSHPERKTVHDYRYLPSTNRVLQSEEVGRTGILEYYNTYDMPIFDMVEETDLLHHFTDHMKYLFQDNYDMAVNWFAQILQEPGKRYRVALYSISLDESTGRGWLVNLFNQLYGDNVTTVRSLEEMFKSGAKNGYLHRSVMVTVNEMKSDKIDKQEGMNMLKTMLSDDYQTIDIKYGGQSYNTKVYTRLFGQSNAIRSLSIDETDTRFLVCLNQKPGRSDAYYEKLYRLLKNNQSQNFLNQVYTYLMKWEINYNWLRKAPHTPDKEKVIRACKDPTSLAFYDFQLMMGDKLFTDKTMNTYLSYQMLNTCHQQDVATRTKVEKHLSVLRTDKIKTSDGVSFNGRRVTVHSFEPYQLSTLEKSKIKSMLVESRKLVTNHIENLK